MIVRESMGREGGKHSTADASPQFDAARMFDAPRAETETAKRPRRALVCAGQSVAAALERQLNEAGYATAVASPSDGPRAVAQFAPDVLLVALHNGMDGDRVALARRLRAEPATYSLPVVFLYNKDERAHRSTALGLGVDDYFPLATPAGELRARLEALFWRAEAGRRAATPAGDRRAEIDNFLLVLDGVRDDLQAEGVGALALIESVPHGAAGKGAAASNGALAEAHGFFKLNLRRADAVAFYGPSQLFVYMPGLGGVAAREVLARLREEFARRRADVDLAVGLAAFPADGDDVEALVEKAEAAVEEARESRAAEHAVGDASVASYVAAESPAAPLPFKAPEADSLEVDDTVDSDEGWILTRPPSVEAAEPLRAAESAHAQGRSESNVSVLRSVPAARAVTWSEASDEWTRRAAEAGARDLERRAGGAIMPRRLLLAVSDAARMAQLNLLVRAAGYDVRAAFDAQQALNLLRIEQPDLVVLDYEMQDVDGLEALRRLRRQSGGQATPPVVLLAGGPPREGLHREAIEAGARAVVPLPCDPSDFLDTVRRAGSVD